jgi:hypothetical protein
VVEVSALFRVEGIREHIFRCEKWVERLRYPLQLEKPYITLIPFHRGLALFPFSVHVVPGERQQQMAIQSVRTEGRMLPTRCATT